MLGGWVFDNSIIIQQGAIFQLWLPFYVQCRYLLWPWLRFGNKGQGVAHILCHGPGCPLFMTRIGRFWVNCWHISYVMSLPLSMDTKKKEYLGNFYRNGHLYTLEQLLTYDHDFTSFAQGVIIPHALYDLKQNVGYINLGTSKETSEFACDCLRNWWYHQGQYDYPNAISILLLCDGGGSNSSRHYIFKQDLQKLVDEIGIDIRIAHYPPYTSKYNPIEHRLFPHVTRACQGVIFTSIELVKELIEKTRTSTGLSVTVQIIDKVYETGRKVADDFKETMRIIFDDFLPQWNYTAIPNREVI